MQVIIENDYESLSQWAAAHVIQRINASRPTADHPFVLGLPTGSTPEGMYALLVKACQEGKVSFRHVVSTTFSTISIARERTYISLTAMPRICKPNAKPTSEASNKQAALTCLSADSALTAISLSTSRDRVCAHARE